jgi:hypothetical protein
LFQNSRSSQQYDPVTSFESEILENKMQLTWSIRLLVLVWCVVANADGVQLGLDMDLGDSSNVLRSWHLVNPIPPFKADPYLSQIDPQLQQEASKMVCGTKLNVEEMSYELITFKSEADARGAGENVAITHAGPCGACSTLADLAVYLGQRDLTTPVRRCGFLSFLGEGIALK